MQALNESIWKKCIAKAWRKQKPMSPSRRNIRKRKLLGQLLYEATFVFFGKIVFRGRSLTL